MNPKLDLSKHIFRNHHVAALAWAFGSAPLMSNSGSKVLEKMLPEDWFSEQLGNGWTWILELDTNPQPLIDFIEKDNPKLLGKYFESLISFWIEKCSDFELLARNIQFRDDHATVGEADLHVKDLYSGETWQIELACKYYLGQLNVRGHENWIGPNGTDSLEQKMTKLEKQTSIFKTSPGRNYLKSNSLKQPDVKIFMKGFFFHHFTMLAKNKSPKNAGMHYNSGWYVYLNELNALFGTLHQWVILPKLHWPCIYNFNPGTERIVTGQEMIDRCTSEMKLHKKAILIAQVEVRDGVIREISRGFVVHDKWPNVRSGL